MLIKGHRFGYPLALRIIPTNDVIAAISGALCVAGLLFCLWARATLGRNWSGTITVKEEHKLVVRGPYRIVRHPIYTGLLAMLLATAMLVGHIAAILGIVVVFVSLWIKLEQEEAVMLRQFPDEYAAYRQRVKRIIPFIV